MRAAVSSVLKREPDEYVVYIDLDVLPNYVNVTDFLQESGVDDIRFFRSPIDAEDHHDDVTRAVHAGILESRHKWVLNCDDDDQIIGDISHLLELTDQDDVGMIYGDRIRSLSDVHKVYIKSRDCVNILRPADIGGSTILYNSEAFREVYQNIDVWNSREEYGEDYGYFWDYKIAFWLMRYGFRLLSCEEVIGLVNANLDRSEKRQSLARAWRSIAQDRYRRPRK